MPLAGTEKTLASAIVAAIKAADPTLTMSAKGIQALASGIATAVIAHIVANAQVAPGITVATSGGAGTTTTPGKVL